jgi:hypothetical protein
MSGWLQLCSAISLRLSRHIMWLTFWREWDSLSGVGVQLAETGIWFSDSSQKVFVYNFICYSID